MNLTQLPPTLFPENEKTKGKRFFVALFIVIFFLSFCFFSGFWFFYRLSKTLPTLDQLENIEPPLSSKVLGKDGSLIHEFSIEKRSWVSLNQIPQDLINAVISIEDRKFFNHWGVDAKRILGAVFVNIRRGHAAQGASTITQQLARNVYLSSKTSIIRKIREAMTAVQIERYYTKMEILELYLNQVYFGAGVYGVEAASLYYFGKHVWELSLNECAVLAGIIQLPEYYRPDKEANLKNILSRRKAVINAMVSMKFIDKKTAQDILSQNMPVYKRKEQNARAPYFIEMVRKYCENKYGDDLLYNGGLTIFTTLDPSAQDSIDKAAKHHLDSLQKKLNIYFLDRTLMHKKLKIPREIFLSKFDSVYEANKEHCEALPDSLKRRIVQTALIAMDVKTGGILALVGGRDFNESKFNRAIQSVRQPGSAFKPIVYTAAINNGFTPASVILDQPITLNTPQGEWRPENYDGKFKGPVTLRYALEHSLNLPAIRTFIEVGGDTVVSYARRMGLKQKMEPVPSLAIGSCEVMPLELLKAYSIFPNKGIMVEPYFIERIVDKNGNILEQHDIEQKQILSPQTAFIMCDLLASVVRRGTGSQIPAMGFTRPSAGKTGTSNDYSDAWFVGFTPQISCVVWIGIDERRSIGYGLTGATGAIPLYTKAMIALHKKLPVKNFEIPEDIISRKVCPVSFGLATPYCPQPYDEFFIYNMLPQECDLHGPNKIHDRNIINTFGPKEKKQGTTQKQRLMF